MKLEPNLWVKLVDHHETEFLRGACLPVSGPPFVAETRPIRPDGTAADTVELRGYQVLHVHRLTEFIPAIPRAILREVEDSGRMLRVRANRADCLNRDQCAELDRKFGLQPREVPVDTVENMCHT